MRKYTQDELVKIKAGLPADMQTALNSVELMEELRKVVVERHLHVDEAGEVADLVELTLSGLVKASEFVRTLKEVLPNKSAEEVSALAENINTRIFAKIHDSLKLLDTTAPKLRESVVVQDVITPTPKPIIPPAPVVVPPVIMPAPLAPVPVPVPVSMPPVLMPSPVPVSTTVPIYESKSAGPTVVTQSVSVNTHENTDMRLKLVPDDLKARINNDPYKEAI